MYLQFPCAGCHGATAQGQFGPPLAGTSPSLEDLRQQVRQPFDLMPAFDKNVLSDQELIHIHTWLTSLPPPEPIPTPQSSAEATAQARDSLYPPMGAEALALLVDQLDELTLRVSGQIVSVEKGQRFTKMWVRVGQGDEAIQVLGLYDTVLTDQAFPAAPGDHVTLYGVGALPKVVQKENGSSEKRPQMQILFVIVE